MLLDLGYDRRALGAPLRPRQLGLDAQAGAVLHQHVSHEAELCRACPCLLAIESRLRMMDKGDIIGRLEAPSAIVSRRQRGQSRA
jgi:hypothetical protein